MLSRRDQPSCLGDGCPDSVPGLGHMCSMRCSFKDLVFQCQKGHSNIRPSGDFQVSAWCLRMYLGPRDDVPAIWLFPHLTLSSFPLSSCCPLYSHPTNVLGALGPRHPLSELIISPLPKTHCPHSPSTSTSTFPFLFPSLGPVLWAAKNPQQTSLITFSTLDRFCLLLVCLSHESMG